MNTPQPLSPSPSPTWSQRMAPFVRAFHAYASWLVGISWKRFFVLSLLLLILAGFLQSIPPFSWTMREVIEERHEAPRPPKHPPKPPREPKDPEGGNREPVIRIEKSNGGNGSEGVDISINENGIRVIRRAAPASGAGADAAASGAQAAPAAPAASGPAAGAASGKPHEIRVEVNRGVAGDEQASIRIVVPDNANSEDIKRAIAEAKQAVQEALREPAIEVAEGAEDRGSSGPTVRISRVHMEDALTDLALLWILASMIIKLTYKGQLQARAEAAQATEMAEAESLKRQVVEARMAAMQAQVEPHFLFNTLASIDHLIETDPPRASRMQKSLIALLRATMPTLRDGGTHAPRTLGQEQAVIVPYLEILKIRMEDRLDTDIQLPDGLRSAECPPMVLQMLVENAIKHGLEPKAEGGKLRVEAAVVHGELQLTVEDSGVGLDAAASAGAQGSGLKNIRERLNLLYGAKASLVLEPRAEGGTRVVVRLPYRVVEQQEGERA